jgi:hypothetical protein
LSLALVNSNDQGMLLISSGKRFENFMLFNLF